MNERGLVEVEVAKNREVTLHNVKAVCVHCQEEFETWHIETEFVGDLIVMVRNGFTDADVRFGGVERKCRSHHKRKSSHLLNHSVWELQRNGEKFGILIVASDSIGGTVSLPMEEVRALSMSDSE